MAVTRRQRHQRRHPSPEQSKLPRASDRKYRSGRVKVLTYASCWTLALTTTTIFFVLCLMVTKCDASFSVLVENGGELCFSVRTPKDQRSTISGNYDCLDDNMSSDPVSVVLYDSKMKPLYSSRHGQSEGTFYRIIGGEGGGRYRLCLGNGANREDDGQDGDSRDGMDRTIGFSLRVRPGLHPPGGDEKEKKEAERSDAAAADEDKSEAERKAAQLLELGGELIERLEDMTDHQDFLRNRHALHRELAESTFSLVLKWTVMEAFILTVVAVAQIMYLRAFVEKRRYL